MVETKFGFITFLRFHVNEMLGRSYGVRKRPYLSTIDVWPFFLHMIIFLIRVVINMDVKGTADGDPSRLSPQKRFPMKCTR